MNRQKSFEYICENPEISVLIIGAGINGIGTFRDLALQDIDVLLVDRGDFCSGASAASSHMAHGGIRYLENGEFRLVNEAVQERNRLLHNAPHYVKPLPTTIPIFKRLSGLFNAPLKFLGLLDKPSERGALVIKAGLMMYDAYTGSQQRAVPAHRFLNRRQSLKNFPKLNPKIEYTATYYDAFISVPERICVELIADAVQDSPTAHALNYVRVAGAAGGSVMLHDEVSDESVYVKPQIVINAAGPWIDFANDALGQQTRFIGGTKGSHLVLDHPELRAAIGEHEFFFENHDGRIVLICPYMDRVLVGTSDIRIENPDEAVCGDEEIDYFLQMVDRVFPAIQIDPSHIVFTYAGVRPLPTSDANSTGQISRDHLTKIVEPTEEVAFPIYNLIGGKWTTFRAFSEQVTDQVLHRLKQPRQQNTKELAIGGGANYPQDLTERDHFLTELEQKSGIDQKKLKQLFMRYGTYSQQIAEFMNGDEQTGDKKTVDRPLEHNSEYSRREIIFLVLHEHVVHLDDLILRRSLMAMLGKLSYALLLELAEILGHTLGWSDSVRHQEIERTCRILSKRHRVNLQPNS